MPGGILTNNSPVHIGGLTVSNPLYQYNPYAGGNSPAPKSAAPKTAAPAPAPVHAAAAPTSAVSTGPTAAQVAAQQQAAALAKAETNYHNNMDATMDTINSGITGGAGDYRQSILDAFNGSGGFKSQQNAINDAGVQNELSKIEGMQGVRDMVGNGIQGAGVILDNDGAGTSSAGRAVARAYGIQGRQQASKVGSQYAQGANTINTQQGNLTDAENNFMNVDAPTKKADTINSIVASANQSLTYLNAIASSASLPDQINIAQRIAQIKAQATAALSAYDGELQNGRNGASASSPDANQAKATQLFTAGTAPAHEFDFTSDVPAQLQDTGPAASSLPIYIAQNKNNSIPAAV